MSDRPDVYQRFIEEVDALVIAAGDPAAKVVGLLPSRVASAHKRYHGRHPVGSCWRCQRGYAMCLSKMTFHDRDEAVGVVVEINHRNDWTDPVMVYPCDWGSRDRPHWHIAHCRKSRDYKRARRLQRRLDPDLSPREAQTNE